MKEIALKIHQIKEKLLIEELKKLPESYELERFAITNKDLYVLIETPNTQGYNYLRVLKGTVVGIEVSVRGEKLTKNTKFENSPPYRTRNLPVYVQDGNMFYKIHIHYEDLILIKE